jgi:hypothetical protein
VRSPASAPMMAEPAEIESAVSTGAVAQGEPSPGTPAVSSPSAPPAPVTLAASRTVVFAAIDDLVSEAAVRGAGGVTGRRARYGVSH